MFNSDLVPDCANITSITIPSSIVTIGDSAFNKCINVASVIFEDIGSSSLQSVGKNAFANLRELTSITFPASLTGIGENALNSNLKLTSITFEGTSPPAIGAGMFTTTNPNVLIYVEAASVSAFKQGTWQSYSTIIRPKTIRVIFDIAGGTPISDQTVSYASSISSPTVVPREGYTFDGWFIDSAYTIAFDFASKINYDIMSDGDKLHSTFTLYANWTANTYTINFDANAEDAIGETQSQVCTYGVQYYLSANGFSYAGHTFAGWATSPTCAVVYGNNEQIQNLTSVKNGTVTLYAVWE